MISILGGEDERGGSVWDLYYQSISGGKPFQPFEEWFKSYSEQNQKYQAYVAGRKDQPGRRSTILSEVDLDKLQEDTRRSREEAASALYSNIAKNQGLTEQGLYNKQRSILGW